MCTDCIWLHRIQQLSLGIYKSEQFSVAQNKWIENDELKIEITVEVNGIVAWRTIERGWRQIFCEFQELPQGHKIVETKSKSSGRFTFTSTESGDHAICLSAASNSWFDSTKTVSVDMNTAPKQVDGYWHTHAHLMFIENLTWYGFRWPNWSSRSQCWRCFW